MEQDAGGSGIARTFVEDFIRIWDKRIGCLTLALMDNDTKSTHDAVLSLKNSALMVGAPRLARWSLELEHMLGQGSLAAMRALLPDLKKAGEMTVAALKKDYLRDETG
ncbi:Hpt domain-containing protein [Arthrobacter sp. MPF02]|uniref:Hpt domain-containing protein n=1 Tax=Arthrobacter sp. MPF02 TaxID=3388492 RepID=UPI003984777B